MQKRSSLGVALFLAAAFISAGAKTPAPRAIVSPAMQSATANHTAPTQLADEITRRLRRIGISFSPTRLPHPYDPAGEVC
jgi:hypothetical protein